MRNLTIAIVMLLSTIGPALVIALVGKSAVQAIGRNPSASSKVMLSMITAFIFAEAIAVLALLIIYSIFR